MTDQFPPAVGTVAQEAARLIEDMATMARSGYPRTEEPSTYAGPPEPESPAESLLEACSMCGAEGAGTTGFETYDGYNNSDSNSSDSNSSDSNSSDSGNADPTDTDGTRDHHEIPTTCRLCPLCKGIELLRAVRPETVDLLADLALSLATTLRDVAKRSRASDHGSSSTSTSGASSPTDRHTVQDIFVDDETEG